jgi:hypothetical protein
MIMSPARLVLARIISNLPDRPPKELCFSQAIQVLLQACTRRAKHVRINKLNWKKRGTPTLKEVESEVVIEVRHEDWIYMFVRKQ